LGSNAKWCPWHVARSAVQPEFPQHVLADFTRICAAITVWSGNVPFRDLAVCYVALLRSRCPWADVADVLADIADDLGVARILAGKPTVLPYLSFVLAGVAAVQPAVPLVQPHIAAILTYESFVQSSISAVLSNFSSSALANVAEVLTDISLGLALLSEILPNLTDVLSSFAVLLPRFAGVQSDLAVLVAIEPRADLERDQPEPLVQRVAIVGLKRPKMTKRTRERDVVFPSCVILLARPCI